MKYIICDMDSCLSDDRQRLHLIKSSGDNRWDEYHLRAEHDPVNPAALAKLKELVGDRRDVRLVISTARPESIRSQTYDWLTEKVPMIRNKDIGLSIYMRPLGCHLTSPELKQRVVERLAPDILHALDDRPDVIEMYQRHNVPCTLLSVHPAPEPITMMELSPRAGTAADILAEAANTFRERNAVYKDNYRMVGPIMSIFFPEGVPTQLLGNDSFHLFELAIVKLSRLAISNLTHADSAHDGAVYMAMIESIIKEKAV